MKVDGFYDGFKLSEMERKKYEYVVLEKEKEIEKYDSRAQIEENFQ